MLRGQESYTEPLEVYELARARGMDFVTITDHNSLAGALAIAHLPGTFLSAEFDTWFPENGCRVHVVASGIDEATFTEAMAARASVYDLVTCLREAGVLHYLAHPLFDMDGRLTPDIAERCLLLFNVLEARNGSRTTRCNGLLQDVVASLTPERIAAMAERQGVAPHGATPWRKSLVGGSDDHSGLFVAGAHTVAASDGGLQDFFAAVARGDCAPGGDDGDARLLAHSIYAASFWRVREILRLDDEAAHQRALGLLRKGFGRIGRDVPVLEKTVRGVRSMAPGLYRDGDRRGPEWEALLDELLGPLAAPHGIAAVGARELDERLFRVVSRLAGNVLEQHLAPLLAPGPLPFKRFLQSSFAVGMVHFLELPYFMAWHLQSRDRGVQARLREQLVHGRGAAGPAAGTAGAPAAQTASPLSLAVLTDAAPGGDGAAFDPAWAGRDAQAALRVQILSLHQRAGQAPGADGEIVTFRTLGELSAGGTTLRVPPLLDVLDHLEESGAEALHVTGPGPMGLAGLAGARLLHLPVSGACGAAHAELVATTMAAPPLLARYLRWFYGRLDVVIVPSRAAARHAVAGGIDPSRVHVSRAGLSPAGRARPRHPLPRP